MRIRAAVCSLLILAGTAAHATLAVADDATDKLAVLKATLQSRFLDVEILDVAPAQIPGLYEVFTGDAIAYSDGTGDHLLVGSLVDTRTRQNMTSERLDARNSIDYRTLPFDKAIKVVKGKGTRQMAVFSDPDCPYCQKLEHELASVDDVTVNIFLFPLTSLHPDARNKAHALWCAQDRSTAWTHWMIDKKLPEDSGCKVDPLDELQALGEKLRISSTPTIFLSNGRRIGGSVPTARLEKLLTNPAAQGADF